MLEHAFIGPGGWDAGEYESNTAVRFHLFLERAMRARCTLCLDLISINGFSVARATDTLLFKGK